MDFIRTLLEVLIWICGAFLTFNMVYQLVIGFWGFGKAKKDYKDHDPEMRFLVLVPAHNEEKVIGDIIENLKDMDYPRELYDFYIIADNCTDNTAEKARSLGAKVIETRKESPDAPTGKPIALKKALNTIDYRNNFDLLMIFDADNLIDRNMFREVNSQYLDKDRPDFIQCYLGAKNKKGPVAWVYYTGYTLSNRFFNLAKQRLGLNGVLGGTGFAMSTSYLAQRGGWTTMTLTEDYEMQVEAILDGRRIVWNHFTRVYDEKPTRLRAAIRQRIRWGQGHWFVTLHNSGKLVRALFAGRISIWEFLSLGTYMYSVAVMVAALLQLVFTAVLSAAFSGQPLFNLSYQSLLISVLTVSYSYCFLFYYADWKDNGIRFSLKTIPPMVVAFFATAIITFFNQVFGLIRCRDQQHWVKTEHCIHAELAPSPAPAATTSHEAA
ncbi:MAG: glycosyltransferase family 2 protein [Clostridia bacterium]|nr:glycosyltransferase family 2 protein [Clostridia bacterium]